MHHKKCLNLLNYGYGYSKENENLPEEKLVCLRESDSEGWGFETPHSPHLIACVFSQ
jgi:hypothetical protein